MIKTTISKIKMRKRPTIYDATTTMTMNDFIICTNIGLSTNVSQRSQQTKNNPQKKTKTNYYY